METTIIPAITGKINHVGLSVRDLHAQIGWYSKVFNMEITQEVERTEPPIKLVLLTAPNGLGIELMARKGSEREKVYGNALETALELGYGHWCLEVDDVQEAYNNMMNAGAISITAPGPSIKAGIEYAYVKDPEGNLIEIIQFV
jgi:catechol 2,3-dioxygenase-like lactoylglutathione lyase family enzyme